MDQSFFSTKGNRILGALTLVMVMLALASFTILNLNQAEQTDMLATISVDGTGEVVAVPDIGTFSFSVEAEGETAAIAQAQSAEKINAILAYLKENGIAEKDIKTENYNLYPNFRFEERPCAFGSFCPPGEQIADGFTVNQSVTVKVRVLDTAGDLIAGVGRVGATNISSLDFTVDDIESVRAKARDMAVQDAKMKAEELAKSLGVRVERLVSYYENTPYYGYNEPHAFEAKDMSFGDIAPQLPVGENATKITVNVTYEVR